MSKKLLLLFTCVFACIIAEASPLRGLWVWNTSEVISNTSKTNILFNQCVADGITDVYVYAYGLTTGTNKTNMQNFIAKASCNNIQVWAMDGYRAYFADWNGRTQYINFINSVITYNKTSTSAQKFAGIQGDNEPQDGQDEPKSSFHNGIAGSALNKTGGGVWKSTEALDRDFLMQDWISMTKQAHDSCKVNGLRYGQAMVSWLDDYYGEPVYCTYNGANKRVLEHIMPFMDDFFIMSYNTNPSNAFSRIKGELAYADSLPANARPRIWAGVETHCGAGVNVTYCDTPNKNTKAIVYSDMASIESSASKYASFAGSNIHDWVGWSLLTPASVKDTDPGCKVTTDIEDEGLRQKAILYPNPVKDYFILNNLNINANISIYNTNGVLVYNTIAETEELKIHFYMAKGLYVVVISSDEKISTLKFIIE